MTRRAPSVFAAHEDVQRATRIGGVLALLASALGVLLALGVSRWSPADQAALLALLSLMAAAGVVAVRSPARMPPLAVAATLVAGTGFVSAGMAIVGSPAVDGADNEMLFLVPLLYSAYFCRGWVTALVTATASASYAALLLTVPSAMPAARWVTTTAALCLVGTLVSVARARDMQRLAAAADEAGRDPLTGLLNRRGLEARAAAKLVGEEPVSLLLIDIDHFKAVNDLHGHVVGDEVLASLAELLRLSGRTGDLVARIGGEEFVVVLPACGAQEAARRADELCRRVERVSRDWSAGVTLSVGTATGGTSATNRLVWLLSAADAALYAAKAAGRNTVRSAGDAVQDAMPPPRNPAHDAGAAVDAQRPAAPSEHAPKG